MKVLVIGGTLFIGRSLVGELVKAGHDVVVLHRKPEHDFGRRVGNIQADRNDCEAIRRAIPAGQFEVVYDMAYDWDRGTTCHHVEAAARASGDRLHRYVFLSSVAAYGDGLNHHEGDALAQDDHHDIYVRNKAMSERLLFRMHQRHGTPVTTIRPPYVYGPGNPYYREAFFWDRLRDNRPVVVPGDGRRLMQFVYVKDLVWSLMKVLEEPAVVGHAFNIANQRPVTQAEAVAAFADAAGRKPTLVRVPRERIQHLGGHPMGPQLYFGMYLDMAPITQVITKAQRVIGLRPTPFSDGLKETYRWYLRHHNKNHIDYSFEDRLMDVAMTMAV